MSVLPGRARRGWSVPDAHHPDPVSHNGAEGSVSVADEVTWRLVPGKGFSDLAGDPFGRRVGGDVRPDQAASLKMDDRQAIKKLEADGRHDKQIDSGDVRSVIAEKGLPALRRRPASSHDILGDGRLGDLDAELEQFAVDTRRAPERVLPTDPSHETTDVGR